MDKYETVKTSVDDVHSWWSNYDGMSCGRVLHYVYNYLGYNHAESVIVSATGYTGTISYYGKVIADIDWTNGFPLFFFTENLSEDLRYIANKKQTEALGATVWGLNRK